MRTPVTKFLFVLTFCIAFHGAIAKPPVKQVTKYSSSASEGLIGTSEEIPIDNPVDNIFHVTLSEAPCEEDVVWLVYDLDGVDDHTSVSRSINDQRAFGGYIVKKRRGWKTQREQISASWLRSGDNVIRFSLPENAIHSYRIKNLSIEIESTPQQPPSIVTHISKNQYSNKAYLKGFLNPTKEDEIVGLKIDGISAPLYNYEFESVVDLSSSPNLCQVDVEVTYASGNILCSSVQFEESDNADYFFERSSQYKKIESLFNTGSSQSIALDGAILKTDSGSLQSATHLSITTLRDVDIAALDAGMVNVTANHAGYRFLPHGTKFLKETKLNLPYDATKIPDGYTEKDIKTYYFDEQAHHWVPVPSDSVDLTPSPSPEERGVGLTPSPSPEEWGVGLPTGKAGVRSLISHFTDYINAIIKVPESPDVEAYNSTSMKGIKAANPTAAVNLINPPQANNTGSAGLSYPINIPAGRAGMQPQLGISYNSGGGNGWLGLGWNLMVPSIGIDTRWGVPRYDAVNETETYSMNGEMLTPVAHRGTLQPRSSEKQFHPRVEGAFNKIIRHGTNPKDYWWEVTDKSGTRYFYGGSPAGFDKTSVLRDDEKNDGGNVAHWCLSEVRDLNGNTVKYHYAKVADVGLAGGTVPGYQIYISKINYTGFNGGDGKYEVVFTRDNPETSGRQDKMIMANLGFKQVTGDRLKKIEVKFDGKNIRHYELDYITSEFYKTLLQKISEFDAAGNKFNEHTFDYFNDVRAGTSLMPLNNAQPWSIPGDNMHGDFITNLNGFKDEATALGGTKSKDLNVGLTVSVGIGFNYVAKTLSAGISGGYSQSKSEGLVTMMDMNGDGLQDKLISKGGLFYRPNISGSSDNADFGNLIPITGPGVDAFFFEKSKTTSLGGEASFVAFVGYSHSWSTSKTTTYMADVNADQLPDIIKNGRVYFNHLDTTTGAITYSTDSQGTPNVIFTSSPISSDIVDKDALEQDRQRAIDQNPLLDVVRMWQAPISGTIKVTAPVQLLPTTDPDRADNKPDGVRVAVQFNGTELWTSVISPDDYSVHQPTGISNLVVNKGDRLFFRVGSRDNGFYDSVRWNPLIEYLNQSQQLRDANRKKLYRYQAGEDFLLSSEQWISPPFNGTMQLTGMLSKPGTTDNLKLTVLMTDRDAEPTQAPDTLWKRKYKWNETVNIFPDTVFAVDTLKRYQFKVISETNIDWNALTWKPKLIYKTATNPEINLQETPITLEAVPEFTLFVNTVKLPKAFKVDLGSAKRDTIKFDPEISFVPEPLFGLNRFDGEITFSVKKLDTLLAKRNLKIVNGQITGDSILTVPVRHGDSLFVEYHTTNFLMGLALNTIRATTAINNTNATAEAGAYTLIPHDKTKNDDPRNDAIFGTLYRGWGHFGWNANRDFATQKIDPALLKVTNISKADAEINTEGMKGEDLESQGSHDLRKERFFILFSSAFEQRWASGDQYAYLLPDVMSSSRLGDDDLSLIEIGIGDASQSTSARGIDRITKTQGDAFTLGISLGISVAGNKSTANSHTMTDFMDMNGDRYPDILTEKIIQYTDARGGLSDKIIPSLGDVQRTHSTSTGWTASGSFPMTMPKFRASQKKSEQKFESGDAASSAGVSINLGGATGENEANYNWMDINGDGLPDRVNMTGGTVALNLGYGFAEPEPWGFTQIMEGGSKTSTAGGGLGFTWGQNSISAGFSLARSDNFSNELLVDINGDGLPDKVRKGNPVQVWLNTGNSFAGPLTWTGTTTISESATASESANAAFTVGFGLWGVKFTVNPSVSGGHAMSRELQKFMDMNGDGYPDVVSSSKDDNLTVSLSTIGRTNMLKGVTRPLGASFTMNYHRVGNTYDLPNSQWVLDEVMVVDGFQGDGVDTLLTTFAYEGGRYDRHEREFYGFDKVITNTHNTAIKSRPVYTTVTQTFSTANYYEKGLLLTEVMKDSGGSLFVQKENTYKLKNTTTGNDLPSITPTNDPGLAFPALVETSQKFYEGQSTAGKNTRMTYGYDVNGNVIEYNDFGDATSEDDLKAIISYHSIPNLYLIGTPKSISVTHNGTTLRKRESVIDNFGNVTQIKQFLTDNEQATHDLEYDQYGNLKKITRPKNSKDQRLSMNYEYDATLNTYPIKVSNSYGYSSEAIYDFRFGQVLESTDLNGNKITYELDDLGRVKNITGPYEKGGANKTIEFEYHPEAAVPWALTNHFDPSNPKNKMQTAIFVDGLGRVLQTKKDAAIYDGEGIPTTVGTDVEVMVVSGRVEFDAFGRTTKAHYPVTENIGTPGTFNANVDAVTPTTTTYDVLNRTLTVKLPDGAETTTEYGFGNDRNGTQQFSTKTTDANGKQTEQFTDVRGRVTSVKNYTSEKDIWTSFVYNAINEQTEATDDLGHTTYSAYDNFGRRIERKHPDAGTTAYSYDLAGNLEQLVTANLAKTGGVIKYTYDFERLMEITYPENPENDVHYTYGAAGASDNRAGRIVLQEDASGAQEFFYGPLGEVVKNVRTMVIPQNDPQTYVTEWKYDTWNRLTSMTYADGEVVDYTYNVGGLLNSMAGKKKGNTFSYVKQLGYDKFEQRVFLWYGNGTKTTYNYEADRRRLQTMTAKTQANRLFMDNTYTYDKVNNILSLENKAPIPGTNLMGGSSQYNYSYDDLYRLTSATGSYKGANDEQTYSLAMSYNSVGGITNKNQTHQKKAQEQKKTTYNLSYVYGSEQPHAPVHIGDNTYTYDANGNQTGWKDDKTAQQRKIMWDEENRIRSVMDNGAFYHYAYDASGERVWKGKSTGQSVFVNGELKAGNGSLGNFIVYVNPYLVLKSGGYTKHYYIEGQRIVSKIGGGFDNNTPTQAGNGKVDYNNIHRKVFDGIVKNLKFLGADGQILTAGKSGKVPPGQVSGTGNISEANRYFYHPDHLGSTRYVTDATGEVYQHLEYFAFGETFVEEHSNTNRTPYLFNGKELDEETGLYYYGARYYDARISVWQSVDPMAEDPTQISKSPYVYVWNNPIVYNDPDGRCPCNPLFNYGVAKGLWSGAKGTWNFFTRDAWKSETWKATGNLLLGAAAMGPNGNIGNLYTVDAAFGTNTVGAVQGMGAAVDNAANKLTSGNPIEQGEVVGELMWGVVEGVAGSKGVGMLSKTKTAANVLSKVDDVAKAAKTGFKLEGQLAQIFGDKKFFSNWLKGNQSLTRMTNPLNAAEAQQIIDNAKKLGLPIESNLKGLQGLEQTGQWGGVHHFKVGNVHIPIEKGLENTLKF